MVAWKELEQAEPEFAARVRRLFDAGRHKTIATLRADGSPRISGIECEFAQGELRFGSMPGARKGADLRRINAAGGLAALCRTIPLVSGFPGRTLES